MHTLQIPRTAVLHFVGIGGIGMSGIAEILQRLGYRVQGSDHSANANIDRLKAVGVDVAIGHSADHLKSATVVVVSSAVKHDNPEVLAARARGLPVVHRSAILAELMRGQQTIAISGTHGKTTTTSLCAALLLEANLDPTIVTGGIMNQCASNAVLGQGTWCVVEADESDGSFVRLPATYAVVTNIDPEHMDHYKTFDQVKKAYAQFVEQVPFYGQAIVCHDHPEVRALYATISNKITYGLDVGADVQAVNVAVGPAGATFDVVFRPEATVVQDWWADRDTSKGMLWRGLRLPMFGRHNVQNSLVVVVLALALGLDEEVVRRTLARFSGVQRRFTVTGQLFGATVVDDYAHHPAEIEAVLKAARQAAGTGRVVAVFQPHRYSRLSDLMSTFATCFDEADTLVLTPVYSAGEAPLAGVTTEALRDRIGAHWAQRGMARAQPSIVDSAEDLVQDLKPALRPGDFVVCMGAGSISQWAHALPMEGTSSLVHPSSKVQGI